MSIREIFLTALRLGFITFGGPTAHLAWYQTTYVQSKKWLTLTEYAQIVSLAQILPGPTSSQAGFGIGYKLAGWRGGLAAWLGFTLPGFALITLFAAGLSPAIDDPRIIQTLKLVVVVIVAHAVITMAQSLLPKASSYLPAGLVAVAVTFTDSRLGFLLVLGYGFWYGRKNAFEITGLLLRNRRWIWAVAIFSGLLASFFIPSNWQFFGIMLQAGLLVIGGGHVVLPILERGIVGNDLMSVSEFLTGYGVMNLLPGPLFNFSGYLGYLNPTSINGLAGAVIATVLIFLPGIGLMFFALPKWNLHADGLLRDFIGGANIAVVGLLAASLWDPVINAVDFTWLKFLVALLGLLLMRKIPLNIAIFVTLGISYLVS
jgi:chromate transporter